MPTTLKHQEHPLMIVEFFDLEKFITDVFTEKYNLRKGVDSKYLSGNRIVFDFRECTPSISEIVQITEWQGGEAEQPPAEVMLNNLVVRGELAYGIYMTTLPFSPEEQR